MSSKAITMVGSEFFSAIKGIPNNVSALFSTPGSTVAVVTLMLAAMVAGAAIVGTVVCCCKLQSCCGQAR